MKVKMENKKDVMNTNITDEKFDETVKSILKFMVTRVQDYEYQPIICLEILVCCINSFAIQTHNREDYFERAIKAIEYLKQKKPIKNLETLEPNNNEDVN